MNELESLAAEILKINAADLQPEIALAKIPRWDSLKFMKLLVTLEKRFSITFEAGDVARLVTWGDLKALIEKYRNLT